MEAALLHPGGALQKTFASLPAGQGPIARGGDAALSQYHLTYIIRLHASVF